MFDLALGRAVSRLETGCGSDPESIIVSNHGGRHLDGTASLSRVLAGIAKAGPNAPVMVDSGFRRSTDVLKAFALGATIVFVGRPFNYPAAMAGEPGARKGISLLRKEISRNMAMLGVTSVLEASGAVMFKGQVAGTTVDLENPS